MMGNACITGLVDMVCDFLGQQIGEGYHAHPAAPGTDEMPVGYEFVTPSAGCGRATLATVTDHTGQRSSVSCA